MTDGEIVVTENSDGSYAVSGDAIGTLSDFSDDSSELIQKVDTMGQEYEKYLTQKTQLDSWILFGVFFLVGLFIGRLLNGLFNT